MIETERLPFTVIVASFFKRLERIESIIRIVLSEAHLSALFTLRGNPEKKVLMDYAKSPARVSINDSIKTGHIYVTIDAEIMHNILVGSMKPGVGVGRREMLLRGSASDLAKFVPLFDLAPLFYWEHLADIGYNGFTRNSGDVPKKESVMRGQIINGTPIYTNNPSLFEKAIFGFVNVVAYVLGYIVGFMRYRLFEKMSLFQTLETMSRGIAAAKPKIEEKDESSNG